MINLCSSTTHSSTYPSALPLLPSPPHLSTYLFTRPLIYPSILFFHPSIHPYMHSSIHHPSGPSSTHPVIHPPSHPSIHPATYTSIQVPSTLPPIHPFLIHSLPANSSIHSFNHCLSIHHPLFYPSTYLPIHCLSTHPYVYLPTHPCTHHSLPAIDLHNQSQLIVLSICVSIHVSECLLRHTHTQAVYVCMYVYMFMMVNMMISRYYSVKLSADF